ncbi:Monocarboxylate transporter 10 [Dufourea novaeangliae]|uniref:Monocarboxylate transporter 10 n=1 Tax=Dufourea novaeangliae TaxID=178035 RepID=A0A154PPL2_DUFNO|nr:Monocarboxylate transporter 10 [Dufourea novaeangliae]
MTFAENAEEKRSSSDLSTARLAMEDPRDVQRSSEENSNVSTEGNPLLESDRKSISVKIESTAGKLKKTDRDEEDRASMNNSRKDPEAVAQKNVAPPDGGARAWMIMIGSFVINGVLFSVINTYSLIYLELQKRLSESGETAASSKAALVGSLTIGTTFFLSPISGILTDKIGIQMTTFLGGALASSGMLLSSIFSSQVTLLYLTYGVMYGLGASLAYTPSLAILGHYFKRYLGLVNGIVTAGSSVFTTLMPYFMEVILRRFGLEGTLRCLAVLTAVVMACALLFKPIPWKFVETVFKGADGKLPIMCIGITSGLGRLIFGYIADLPKVDRILLQQISFISIGVLTMLLPVTPSFVVLLLISLAMGLFDGCFISLLGPIAFDICGRKGATQAIGFLLGMCSIPLTVGPPIAGLLYDHTGSYDLPFFLAGIPPIVGALMMFLIKFVKDDDQNCIRENADSKAASQNGRNNVTVSSTPHQILRSHFSSVLSIAIFVSSYELDCQPVVTGRLFNENMAWQEREGVVNVNGSIKGKGIRDG